MSAHEPLEPTITPITTPITASRRYPQAPLVGVGVAVFNTQGEVLLVQRGKPPRVGQWSLPGGLIDLGERLVAAARREVMEETGVTIEIGDLITTFEPIERDATGRVEYHYVVLDFWGRYVAGEPTAQDDALAVAWVAPSELEDYAVSVEVLAVVRKGHAAWAAAQP
jgi:ADP-ribose pyrophosphatase YjhB (NUDIX family)